MSLAELSFGIVLVVVLLAVGFYFGWRQIKTWRDLNEQAGDHSHADRLYLRRQVQRRLVCSLLMLIFAGFLVGWFFLYPEVAAVGRPDPDQAAEHPFVRTITYYWMAALFVLFGLLSLAAFDLIATARHGFRSSRLLANERRAELEAEVARIRRERAERNCMVHVRAFSKMFIKSLTTTPTMVRIGTSGSDSRPARLL